MMCNDSFNKTALRQKVSPFLPKLAKVRSNISENKEEFDPVTAH